MCYELYGQSQKQCDDLLWMNIKTLCPPNGIFGVKICRTGADMAWETLQDWGHVAYSDYWKKQIPAPVKCEKNCKCGPDKFVATFDWTTYPYTLTYQEIKNNQTINQSIKITWTMAELNFSLLITFDYISFFFDWNDGNSMGWKLNFCTFWVIKYSKLLTSPCIIISVISLLTNI